MLIIKEQEDSAIIEAVKALKAGQIISFATETVYALACDAANDKAVSKLYQIKQRQANKPIAVFAANLKMAEKFLIFNKIEKKIADNFMPGAITLILKKKKISANNYGLSPLLNRSSQDLGFRIPDHSFTLKLLKSFKDGFIAATSANISNKKAAVNCQEVVKYFGDKVDLIIDGGKCLYQIASTVVKVDNKGKINIIRQGLVTEQNIVSIT